MTRKTDLIRDALADGPLALSALMEKTGLNAAKKTLAICAYLAKRGQVSLDRDGDEPVIKLGGRRKPAKMARKVARRPRRKVRTSKTMADVLAKAQRPGLRELALDNLLASTRALIDAVSERVDGLDGDPVLSGAVDRCGRDMRVAEMVSV